MIIVIKPTKFLIETVTKIRCCFSAACGLQDWRFREGNILFCTLILYDSHLNNVCSQLLGKLLVYNDGVVLAVKVRLIISTDEFLVD